MKLKYGKSIEITDQLSSKAATAIAQWIGCYTVIYNQKTTDANEAYCGWLADGMPEGKRPEDNAQVAYLSKNLDFLNDVPCQIRRNAGAKWLEAVNAGKCGLRKRPKIKNKNKKRNCYVTNELFDVQALNANQCLIQLKPDATQKNKGIYLAGFIMPFAKDAASKSFYLSRKGNRFWLSMSYDSEVNALSESEIKAIAVTLTDEDLASVVTAYDAGVVRQMTGSDQTVYHLSAKDQEKIILLETRIVKCQRHYSRASLVNDRVSGFKKRPRTHRERKLLNAIGGYHKAK